MRTRLKRLKITLFAFLAFNIAEVIVYITLNAVGILDSYDILHTFFSVATPILFLLWAFVLSLYIDLSSLFRELKIENRYYLGRDTDFYNYAIFSREVKRILFNRRKENFFLIAFTACGHEATPNLIKNDSITELNYLISEMIKDYFKKNRLYDHFDSTYCFQRETFLVFLSGDEKRANKVIKDFETEIYEIGKRNSLRVFIQPFFGISSYDKEETLNFNFEHAFLSRAQSERNFELATYYNESLNYKTDSEETDEIVEALKNGKFVVYYQPKFNLSSKRFISSEGLIRWDSKKYGLLSPNRFIAKAEAAGLIHDIDMYVFEKVCEDLNDMKKRGKRYIPVSVNFSLYEFYSPNFVEDIIRIIDSKNIAHNLIEIEITETTSQANPFLSISIMKKLKEQGIKVLMDDFGVGFSNFNNLRKMPIDSLKIDKSFIDDIVTDTKTREIVKFLVSLSKLNGLEAIAEGVDNIEQVEILKKIKMDTIQGYFYSKPLSKKDYEAFLTYNEFEKKGGNKQ